MTKKRVSMDDWVTEQMADIAVEELRNEDRGPHFNTMVAVVKQSILDHRSDMHAVFQACIREGVGEGSVEDLHAAIKEAYKEVHFD